MMKPRARGNHYFEVVYSRVQRAKQPHKLNSWGYLTRNLSCHSPAVKTIIVRVDFIR